MATVGKRLARLNSELSDDEAYTAGLLADVGGLALAQVDGERYVKASLETAHGPELLQVEQAMFGFTHPQLGAALLTRWSLPERIIIAIEHHHEFGADRSLMESVVHAGWLMSEALWTPQSPHVRAARSFLQEHFGVDLDAFIDLAQRCRNDIEESAQIFGVKLDQPLDCDQLVDEARRLAIDTALEATIELDAIETVAEGMTP
jgi:hypothetical protein